MAHERLAAAEQLSRHVLNDGGVDAMRRLFRIVLPKLWVHRDLDGLLRLLFAGEEAVEVVEAVPNSDVEGAAKRKQVVVGVVGAAVAGLVVGAVDGAPLGAAVSRVVVGRSVGCTDGGEVGAAEGTAAGDSVVWVEVAVVVTLVVVQAVVVVVVPLLVGQG